MNFSGLIVGVAVFLIIGICHPITIKMEYYWGKRSWLVFCAAGVIFTVASILVDGMILSTILGAAAFSCFWGIHEIISQEVRVLRGWFPENPARHEYYERRRAELGDAILKSHPSHKHLKEKLGK
ncbi:MAG: DUF4491 family protein [Bacteroidales bacterium]|nr:DUF4491 family protein [Bacteroidales bacterium]